jgi:FlaA1/EpsC-like NDP-sugar epimerase
MKKINIGIIGYEKKFSKFFKYSLHKNSIYNVKFVIKKSYNKKNFKKKIYDELKKNQIKFLVTCNKKYNYQITEVVNFLINKKIIIVQASTNYEIENHGYIVQKYFKDFSFRDIFLRETLKINKNLIAKDINNKKILVSGGGGSIGSNLILNLIKFKIKRIFVVDNNEYSIFKLREKLPVAIIDKIDFKILDINDVSSLKKYIKKIKPNLIFHTAAIKHVGFLEKNPVEGVRTNVFGTKNLLEAAVKYKVKKFIHISTDKAADPKNILGITKFFSELVCANSVSKKTKIGIVRFGNVFDSSGSVGEIFRNKIVNSKKICISHKLAERFFMSKEESSNLILNIQNYMNNKNRIQMYTHDMGTSVNILELAKKMAFLSGRNPDNVISKKFTGLMQGEKLKEQLLNDFETIVHKDRNNIIQFQTKNNFSLKLILNKLEIIFAKDWSIKKNNTYIKKIKEDNFNKLSSY